MKKQINLFILLTLALMFTACSQEESKEDVIQAIEDNMNEVEKYFTEAEVKITLTDTDDEIIDENQEIESVYRNDNTNESSGKMDRVNSQIVNYYSTTEATYAQMNDEPWQDMTAEEEVFKSSKTTYSNVAQIIIDLIDEEEFEMEETDDHYVFTFTGMSETVYKAFEYPYSLTLEIAEREDVEQDLKIVVERETHLIDQVDNDLSVEHEGQNLSIVVSQIFEQINEIDDIEIPQEVIDEAG